MSEMEERIAEVIAAFTDDHPNWSPYDLACAVIAAMRDERRLAFERAAEIAKGWLDNFSEHEIEHVSAKDYASDAVRDIHAAILAEIDQPEKEKAK